MKKYRALFLVIILAVFNLMTFGVSAADSQQLQVYFAAEGEPLTGVNFYLYRIGSLSGNRIILSEDFASYSVDTSVADTEQMAGLAMTLSGYILRDDIPADYTDLTDEDGIADFENEKLVAGTYILLADKHHQDKTTYFCEPTLIQIPYGEDDVLTVKPKYDSVDDETKTVTVSYKVLKAWINDHGIERPVEIEVELLRDGEVYDTVKLTEKNNWRYTWEDLSVFYQWTVVEKWVSEGYKVSLTQDGKTLMLSNSGGGEEEETTTTPDDSTTRPQGTTKPDDEDKLPATGALRWPIPYLAGFGLLLIIIGYAKIRKSELADE